MKCQQNLVEKTPLQNYRTFHSFHSFLGNLIKIKNGETRAMTRFCAISTGRLLGHTMKFRSFLISDA